MHVRFPPPPGDPGSHQRVDSRTTKISRAGDAGDRNGDEHRSGDPIADRLTPEEPVPRVGLTPAKPRQHRRQAFEPSPAGRSPRRSHRRAPRTTQQIPVRAVPGRPRSARSEGDCSFRSSRADRPDRAGAPVRRKASAQATSGGSSCCSGSPPATSRASPPAARAGSSTRGWPLLGACQPAPSAPQLAGRARAVRDELDAGASPWDNALVRSRSRRSWIACSSSEFRFRPSRRSPLPWHLPPAVCLTVLLRLLALVAQLLDLGTDAGCLDLSPLGRRLGRLQSLARLPFAPPGYVGRLPPALRPDFSPPLPCRRHTVATCLPTCAKSTDPPGRGDGFAGSLRGSRLGNDVSSSLRDLLRSALLALRLLATEHCEHHRSFPLQRDAFSGLVTDGSTALSVVTLGDPYPSNGVRELEPGAIAGRLIRASADRHGACPCVAS